MQAVLATFGVFFVMLFLYATRIIKVTKRYVMVVVAATLGIMVMYLVDLGRHAVRRRHRLLERAVAARHRHQRRDRDRRRAQPGASTSTSSSGPSTAGAPRYMEWTGALGVTVTIVWIYLEMLRLLALLRR